MITTHSRPMLLATLLAMFVPLAQAQAGGDLNLQLHGYATQGLIYTSHNNWNTTDSSDGSPAWTEAVVNLSAEPESRLRIGIQARFFLLGTYGNQFSLDWAQADFKLNEGIGFRLGKVKTPSGLLNETQDIDPAHLWVVLPQSVYTLASRNTQLSHYGGVLYGSAALGPGLGRVEYRAFGGDRVVSGNDGVLLQERDNGLTFPNGLTGPVLGGTLKWKSPVPGLLLGTTYLYERHSGEVDAGSTTGTFNSGRIGNPFYFAQYERGRWMAAAEFNRFTLNPTTTLLGQAPSSSPSDVHNWYVMASYKLKPRVTVGAYYSASLDHLAPYDKNRYQKDWAFAARFDPNPFLYLKFEQHLDNGTAIGFDTSDNTSLETRFAMTLFKAGVTF